MIKLINLQRDVYSGYDSGHFYEEPKEPEYFERSGNSLGPKNNEIGWEKVPSWVDIILLNNKCLTSKNKVTYDTYVPTVHIDNLRGAVNDGYLHGYEEGLRESKKVIYILLGVFFVLVLLGVTLKF